MSFVQEDEDKIKKFLEAKISELEKDKKELQDKLTDQTFLTCKYRTKAELFKRLP